MISAPWADAPAAPRTDERGHHLHIVESGCVGPVLREHGTAVCISIALPDSLGGDACVVQGLLDAKVEAADAAEE